MGEDVLQTSRSDGGIGAFNAYDHALGRCTPHLRDGNIQRGKCRWLACMRAQLDVQRHPILGNATADTGANMDCNRIGRRIPMSGKFQWIL
jgi:hypothetical protein